MAKQKDDKKDKAKDKEKPKDLTALLKSINKAHGDGSVMQGRDSIVRVYSVPTQVASIDNALGIGGLPEGRVIELFGLESSGKTTTCLQFIKACQKHYFEHKSRYGVAAFVDAEHAYDPDWAAKCGVDTEALIFSQPNSGEEALDIVDRMCESGLVDLVVVDSVANLVPKQELEGAITDNVIGAQARLMAKGLRIISTKTSKSKTTVIFINQIRHKIGVMFGSPETTPGGLALKFYSSVRAQVSKGSPIKDGDDTVGFQPTIKFIKNKCAPPFTSAGYDICFGINGLPYGIDETASLIEVGKELELIQTSSSYYVIEGGKVNGLAAATALIRDNEGVQKALKEKIYGILRNRPITSASVDDADADGGDTLDDDILDQVLDGDSE